MITEGMRRYAAEIYRLQEEDEYASLSELAEHAGASLQAASRMLARLKNAGLVVHEPYRGARLTPSGVKAALPAIRRHRVVEVFLVRVLGLGWHEVHDYSDTFEKGIDDRIEARIFEAAGRPTRCPHGEPIPTPDGVMPLINDASLVEKQTGGGYTISRVRIHDPEKLDYLGQLGLYPGTNFQLLSLAPFQGPVRIRIKDQEQVLSYHLAEALYVE